MSVTPRIALVAYEARQSDFIFVSVPDERGRYVRTDKSVAFMCCGVCNAIVGEPCKGRNGYHGGTHVGRRAAARRFRSYEADDVLEAVPFVPDEFMEPVA